MDRTTRMNRAIGLEIGATAAQVAPAVKLLDEGAAVPFGAFVDIGVHQDGLVHVSQLADRFVKDPHEVVKAGNVVQVRVTEVDVARKRIGLSMRADGEASATDDHSACASSRQARPSKPD